MATKTAAEIERMFGVTSEQLDKWEADATRGVFRGTPGKIEVGRPLMFGQRMRQVGFKEPETKVAAIDKRADQLGMKRSDYLRYLVDSDLEKAGIA